MKSLMIVETPIRDIFVPETRRATDLEKVTSLAESIRNVGLLQPIGVNKDFRLIWGLHRLEACQSLGWHAIGARVVNLTGLAAELAEIDENLERSELPQLLHYQALARRKEIYLAIHPETGRGTAGAIASNAAQDVKLMTTAAGKNASARSAVAEPIIDQQVASFVTDTAAKTGKSKRTIYQDVAVGENLDSQAAADIADVPAVADSKKQLAALSRLPAAEQRRVAAKIKAGKASTVTAATTGKLPGGGGKQKSDPRPFASLEAYLGHALPKIDALKKAHPAEKFHRQMIQQVKGAMQTLVDWQKAIR